MIKGAGSAGVAARPCGRPQRPSSAGRPDRQQQ